MSVRSLGSGAQPGPASPWGSGEVRAAGGPGPTTVELADLTAAVTSLHAAARALRTASAELWGAAVTARSAAPVVPWGAAGTGPVLGGVEGSPAVDADRAERDCRTAHIVAGAVDDLVVRLRRVVTHYADAESSVWRTVHRLVTLDAQVIGETPALWPMLAPLVVPGAEVLAGVTVVGRLTSTTGNLSAAQVPEQAVEPLAGFLRGALPGTRPVVDDPFRALSAEIAGGDAAPTVVLPRADPPQLAAPRTAADVLGNVAASYPERQGGAAGTPPSTISVQRLQHPDGTVGWVVEIPGTQSSSFGGDVPSDMTTNARLTAGLPDDMSTAVLHALEDAGVGAGEPVALAGHSQGGMVAVAAASLAAGAYDVRAVLTAGSPDVPRRVPAKVHVRHYRVDEDLVPQTDARPDTESSNVVVIRRSVGPQNVTHAHALTGYVRTAELAQDQLAGSPAMRDFDAALADVLGPDGTTATTSQYSVTRNAQMVRTDPATGLPRTPTIRRAP